MINLFKNVFIDYERHYNTKYDHIYVSSKDSFHPISIVLGEDVGSVKKFEDYLEIDHKGEESNFWKYLFDLDDARPFVVYADKEMLVRLLLTFWKSIFKDLPNEKLVEIYNCFALESKGAMILIQTDRADNPLTSTNDPYFDDLSGEELAEIFDKVQCINFLKGLDREFLSVEYLIADYLGSGDTARDKVTFFSLIKKNAWESWFFDIQEVKSQIGLALHDLSKMFPELEGWEKGTQSIEEVFRSHPLLSWIVDDNFNVFSINHVVKNYDPEIFSELQRRCDEAFFVRFFDEEFFVQFSRDGKKINSLDIYNQASQCVDLFSFNYEKIFEDDVKRGYGCNLISRLQPFRLGGFFAQRLYSYKRKNSQKDLDCYRLN